ncbi:MAG: hypothetical protein ABI539_01250 [Acidobacteriota bacterium]
MRSKQPKYELREVNNYGEIGAGRIIAFPKPSPTKVLVLVPENTSDDAIIGTLTVRGKSLTDEGIVDGDQLVMTRRFSHKDIKPDTICSVYVRSLGEVLAKKIVKSPVPGMIILRSSGPGEKDIVVEADDIEVQGIAYSLLRMADKHGRFGSRPDDGDIPF